MPPNQQKFGFGQGHGKEPRQARLFFDLLAGHAHDDDCQILRAQVMNDYRTSNNVYRYGERVEVEATIRIRWIIIVTLFIPFAGACERNPIASLRQFNC